MGTSPSSNKVASSNQESNEVAPILPGYAFPEPPITSIDDIRTPIPWYRKDTNNDEFDWAELEKERSFVEERASNTDRTDRGSKSTVKTPLSVIRPATVMTVPLSNRKLRTPSGRMVSFVGHIRTRELVSRTESKMSAGAISMRGVKLQDSVRFDQISFEKIDEHARKTLPIHTKTFTSLTDYLKQPVRYHRRSELLTARALVVWLAYQKIKKVRLKKPDTKTPMGLINSLARGSISYAVAYTILCREAGLQCVLIDGLSKLINYEVGDEDMSLMEDEWTAVYIDRNWQIVHPNCICQGLYGGSFNSWIRREIENKGMSRQVAIKFLKSLVKEFFHEDYFMPLPEVFVHMCYADDTPWQLLPPAYTIRSRDDFLSLPYILPAFFKLGFKLVSKPTCIQLAKNGICKIWIANETKCAHEIILNYELSLLQTEYTDIYHVIQNFRRLVIHSRHDDQFYFEVRFPFEGSFKLEIYGGYHGAHMMRLCHFKLVCTERLKTLKYIPYESGELMWGHGPVAQKSGLTLPSMPTGIVKFHPHRKTPVVSENAAVLVYPKKVFSFLVDPDAAKCTEYSCTLLGFTKDDFENDATPLDQSGDLKTQTMIKEKEKKLKTDDQILPQKRNFDSESLYFERTASNRHLTITVTVPHEGEFALVIYGRKFKTLKNGKKQSYEPKPACAYLIRTVNNPHTESVPQRLARSQLQTEMSGDNVTAIRNATDKCIRLKIPNTDDEIVSANTKWEYLAFKKELNDAIHRRNLRIVNDSLRRISTYRFRSALHLKIRRLFKLRQQLKSLSEFRDDIPALIDAGMEIIPMVDPPPEVHLTMAALFLLLDEPEKYVESWDYIVQRISSDTLPEEAPIYKKMHLIAEIFPSKNTQRKINSLLSEYGLDKVRGTSVAAARFHRWVGKVMAVLQDAQYEIVDDEDTEEVSESQNKQPASGTTPKVHVT